MAKTDPNAAPIKPAATSTPSTNVVPLPATPTEMKPSEKVVAFVKRHPVLTVAGAVAAGAIVSTLIPRRASRKALSRAMTLAETVGASTMLFSREAGEKAHKLGHNAKEQASEFGHKAEHAGHETALLLEKYGLAAISAASALGKATAVRTGKLSHAAARGASRIGDAASERSEKVKTLAHDLKSRISR